MKRWTWLEAGHVIAFHAETIAEHGGAAGLRDRGLLESALARPKNSAAYGEKDPFVLAAAYAFGLAKNHPFRDGNKRVALIASLVFLELNGWECSPEEPDAAVAYVELAAGKRSEEAFSQWLEANCRKIRRRR